MTTQQQTDLKLWKQNQSQPLPASLENILIEDCYNYLESFEDYEAHPFNKNHLQYLYENKWMDGNGYEGDFKSWNEPFQIYIIQTLLSRTLDGKAVMPFLDVFVKSLHKENSFMSFKLDEYLFSNFTNALRVGKTFEEALFTINLIYSQNI